MKIHKLTEVLLPGEADAQVVEALRDLLARAERGEISGIAWAGCAPNETAFNGWQGAAGTMFHLGAGIMMLHARYAEMMQETVK
jgi:hypothetical protein